MPYLRWLETVRCHGSRAAIMEENRVVTFAELAAAVAAAPAARRPVIARSGGSGFFIDVLRAWRDGQPAIPVERDAPEPTLAMPPPAGTCLVKYTPGASGIPRGIFLTGAQVVADGDRLAAAMRLTPAMPNLAVISLAHSYGFSNIFLPLVLHGVPVRLAPVPFPRVIEEAFRQHRALAVAAVPAIWRAWHRAGILAGSPVRLAISAGAPLSLELECEAFRAAGLKIHNFYGASECGGISYDATEEPRAAADDLGTPLAGVSVATAADGRLLVASSSVATGYDAPRADDLLENGRYLTRDIGFLDESGRLRLTGTIGGAINVAGRKVSPAKVEAALLATGLAKTARVAGVASRDAERGGEISATVSLAAGATLDALKSAAGNHLQPWELPRHWQVE